MIPITKILFSKEEECAVLKVLRSGILTQGKKIEEFEKNFAKYIGTKYAVAVSNGTAALHLATLALGLKKDDEVITTPFSFIASTNAILYVGAEPVFVDIGTDYNIDASKIEEKITSRTRAILLVHLYGNPCDMDAILQIAKKYKLAVIEDAAQAHGAEYKGKKMGSFGKVACFSFYATKNMTTGGEGGMITTNDYNLYSYLKMARSHGSSLRYYHSFLGYNFRMTEMQAAIGRIQLKKLDMFNNKRINHARYYNNGLKNIVGLITPSIMAFKKHVFHQYTIRITKDFPIDRKQLIRLFEKKGIGYSIFYPVPIHKQEQLLKMGYTIRLPISETMSQEVVSLPMYPNLKKIDQDYIISTIKKIQKSE